MKRGEDGKEKARGGVEMKYKESEDECMAADGFTG